MSVEEGETALAGHLGGLTRIAAEHHHLPVPTGGVHGSVRLPRRQTGRRRHHADGVEPGGALSLDSLTHHGTGEEPGDAQADVDQEDRPPAPAHHVATVVGQRSCADQPDRW